MLSPTELTKFVHCYGPTIEKVSRQVARQYNSNGSEVGYGWQIIEVEDLTQDVILQLARADMSVDALDSLDVPQAWIRTTARQRARTTARRRNREVIAPFSHGDKVTDDASPPVLDLLMSETTVGIPEREVLWRDAERRLRWFFAEILLSLRRSEQRRVVELYYIGGLDAPAIARFMDRSPAAVRKLLQRARQVLGPEAEAALRAWREVEYPDAKRPQATGSIATRLGRLLESHPGATFMIR